MTLELEQEESIGLIEQLCILPIEKKVTVAENEDFSKTVCRTYCIHSENNKYSNMNTIVIEYRMGKRTERVEDYSVYLTDGKDNTVYLCKYSPEIFNTLFNNIILLEMSNWRKASEGKKPLRTIKDFDSYKFELEIDSHKREDNLLQKLLDKNTSNFFNRFTEYRNSNKIIPTNIWKAQII